MLVLLFEYLFIGNVFFFFFVFHALAFSIYLVGIAGCCSVHPIQSSSCPTHHDPSSSLSLSLSPSLNTIISLQEETSQAR